jgi:hypothetical protein
MRGRASAAPHAGAREYGQRPAGLARPAGPSGGLAGAVDRLPDFARLPG